MSPEMELLIAALLDECVPPLCGCEPYLCITCAHKVVMTQTQHIRLFKPTYQNLLLDFYELPLQIRDTSSPLAPLH
jgi:hypothetical protein